MKKSLLFGLGLVLANVASLAVASSAHAAFAYGHNADKASALYSTCIIDSTTAVTSTNPGVQFGTPGPTGVIGALKCTGENNYGQLGRGTVDNNAHPTWAIPTGMDSGVHAVAGMSAGFCALKNGQVYCWGYGLDGEMGDGTTTSESTPHLVPNTASFTNSNISDLVTGAGHVCVIKDHSAAGAHFGDMYCWGWNANGQVGNNSIANQLTPVKILLGTNTQPLWTGFVTAGYDFTCAQAGLQANPANRPLACWGDNARGQLGDTTVMDRHIPTGVHAAGDNTSMGESNAPGIHSGQIQGLSASKMSMCALIFSDTYASGGHSGQLYCWGDNTYAQISTTTATGSAPVTQSTYTNHFGLSQLSVSGGGYNVHYCSTVVHGSDVNVYCWGFDVSQTNPTVVRAFAQVPMIYCTPCGGFVYIKDSNFSAIVTANWFSIASDDVQAYGIGEDYFGEALDNIHKTEGGPPTLSTSMYWSRTDFTF